MTSLPSALMAFGINCGFAKTSDPLARSTTGGESGSGKWRTDTTSTQPTEEEYETILMLLNELKLDVSSIKKSLLDVKSEVGSI